MSVREPTWVFKPSILETVCLIAGAALVLAYAWLMDDAYVYFRYVDNFVVHNQGLVWNPGEFVEGFSSPLWVLVLSAARSLHLNFWSIIISLGIFCYLVFWWLVCVINRGLTATEDGASWNIPLIYLTFTYGISCYFTSGLESPMVNVIAAVFVAAILWPRHKGLQFLVGVAPLVRQELLLPTLMLILHSLMFRKRLPLATVLSLVVCTGGYELFRIWYYADLFPNTYYLKNISWINQGALYVLDTILPYQLIPYGLAMFFMAFLNSKRLARQDLYLNERLLCVLIAIPVAAYVVKIGGDPRHFRYLAFPYIVFVVATAGLLESMVPSAVGRATVPPFALCFMLLMLSQYPRQLEQHPLLRIPMADVNHFVNGIGDAAAHRLRSNQVTPQPGDSAEYLSYAAAKTRYSEESQSKELISRAPRGEPIPDRRIAYTTGAAGLPIFADSWCQNGFLHPALPVIHDYGLTEPFLARTIMRSDRPAHKQGLRPLAIDIMNIRASYGFAPGAFRQAVETMPAPPAWIEKNLATFEIIEKKIFNRHNLAENITMALTQVAPIRP